MMYSLFICWDNILCHIQTAQITHNRIKYYAKFSCQPPDFTGEGAAYSRRKSRASLLLFVSNPGQYHLLPRQLLQSERSRRAAHRNQSDSFESNPRRGCGPPLQWSLFLLLDDIQYGYLRRLLAMKCWWLDILTVVHRINASHFAAQALHDKCRHCVSHESDDVGKVS